MVVVVVLLLLLLLPLHLMVLHLLAMHAAGRGALQHQPLVLADAQARPQLQRQRAPARVAAPGGAHEVKQAAAAPGRVRALQQQAEAGHLWVCWAGQELSQRAWWGGRLQLR